ncbi:uncharacterized protein G2W53_003594 [Senna tora]|uniref:Uncharacterized protein n=1 Tax=Senna tora TaxID=362788 RepID=A0A834XA81_9FABA|nr:uncharacterized protein G2W53_003594 [Senna tora]
MRLARGGVTTPSVEGIEVKGGKRKSMEEGMNEITDIENGDAWNEELLKMAFDETICQHIMCIPPNSAQGGDKSSVPVGDNEIQS